MIEQKLAPKKTSIVSSIVNTIIPKTNALLKELSLEDCRITQNEDSHIKKGNGSMYAYDVGCGGKSFKVYTPSYHNIYVIEKIGYDKRLGDYIILKHGDIRFVYGHIFTQLKEGERLQPKQILGQTNKSGISNGHHLHIELWRGFNNIKWSYLYDGKEIINNKSYDIRLQRGLIETKEINQNILEFISNFEGYRECAYFDFKHYSIGFGTKAKSKDECITKEEGNKRGREVIQSIRDRYNLHLYSIEVQTAVVSFVYNIGSLNQKQLRLLRNGYYTALGNNFKQYNKITINGEKVIAGGLVKRRQAEYNLLTK